MIHWGHQVTLLCKLAFHPCEAYGDEEDMDKEPPIQHKGKTKFIQNKHHIKDASTAFCHKFVASKFNIALIQDSWVTKGSIRGLNSTGSMILYAEPKSNNRDCILVCKNINGILLPKFRLPLWSSGQSSWLQIPKSGFYSQHYQIICEVLGLERGQLSLVSYLKK
jgi:hypothetical protein